MNRIPAFFAVLLLASCGFHLKGSSPYDRLPVQTWQISGAGPLRAELENAVRYADGIPSDAQAQAELQILSVEESKEIYTVTRAAKLNEYLLTLRVQAQALRGGRVWGDVMTVEVRRHLPYADSLVLGKQIEEQTIKQEMRADAAAQLVRRLAFLKD